MNLFYLFYAKCDIVIFPVVFNFVLPSVECKAVFDSVSTTADSTILLQIYLRFVFLESLNPKQLSPLTLKL